MSGAGRRERVFVVEDHDRMRDMIQLAIATQKEFETCGAAASGEEALEMMVRARPTLALIDLSLPGINGFEVITAALTSLPDLRCIVLSGHQQQYYAAKAFELGASGYVLKGNPVEIFDALRAVSQGGTYLSEGLVKN